MKTSPTMPEKRFNVSISGQIAADSESHAYAILASLLTHLGKGGPMPPEFPDFIVRVIGAADPVD